MLTGGGDSDPATMQSMYLELQLQQSMFVYQAFTEPGDRGIVAVIVIAKEGLKRFLASEEDVRVVGCVHVYPAFVQPLL